MVTESSIQNQIRVENQLAKVVPSESEWVKKRSKPGKGFIPSVDVPKHYYTFSWSDEERDTVTVCYEKLPFTV